MATNEFSHAQRLSFPELVSGLYRFRYWLVSWTLIPALLAVGYWYSTAPQYRAAILLEVAEKLQDRTALSDISLPPSLGGIASLAGITSPSDKEVTLAVLRSHAMARDFIAENGLLPELFPNQWDATSMKWRSRSGLAPTMGKAVRRFHRRVLSVEHDSATGLIEIKMQSSSPEFAARWANDYVALANKRMRERALIDANKRLSFLWKEIERAPQVESREVIARLIQTEINNSMLASVSEDFALRILDPAVVPDRDDYVWPRLTMLLVISTSIGLIIGLVTAALWRRHAG